MRHILAEVEFEDRPIRHAYLTCPECGRKFEIYDLLGGRQLSLSEASLEWNDYCCPVCEGHFGYTEGDKLDIKKVAYPDCARGVYKKKEVWEMKK